MLFNEICEQSSLWKTLPSTGALTETSRWHNYEPCFTFERPLTRIWASGLLFRLNFFVTFFVGMSWLNSHNTLKQEVATSFYLTSTSNPSITQLHVSHHSLSHKFLSLKITVTYTEWINWPRRLAYFNIFFF